jgi:hypothetical protein
MIHSFEAASLLKLLDLVKKNGDFSSFLYFQIVLWGLLRDAPRGILVCCGACVQRNRDYARLCCLQFLVIKASATEFVGCTNPDDT